MSKTFRPYELNQWLLLPPDLREWLPEDHLALFASDVADALDLLLGEVATRSHTTWWLAKSLWAGWPRTMLVSCAIVVHRSRRFAHVDDYHCRFGDCYVHRPGRGPREGSSDTMMLEAKESARLRTRHSLASLAAGRGYRCRLRRVSSRCHLFLSCLSVPCSKHSHNPS